MIAIVNVSTDAPPKGICDYEVRINQHVIATFKHSRKFSGAAQCLRDAADAVDKCREEDKKALLRALGAFVD
jgi:hypothetical protein